jgi:hypothetical protein
VFNVHSTVTGRLTYLRMYSGTIREGDVVLDVGAPRTKRINRILRVHADRHAEVGTRRWPGTSSRWSGRGPPAPGLRSLPRTRFRMTAGGLASVGRLAEGGLRGDQTAR